MNIGNKNRIVIHKELWFILYIIAETSERGTLRRVGRTGELKA
jgi:hypothetical protein